MFGIPLGPKELYRYTPKPYPKGDHMYGWDGKDGTSETYEAAKYRGTFTSDKTEPKPSLTMPDLVRIMRDLRAANAVDDMEIRKTFELELGNDNVFIVEQPEQRTKKIDLDAWPDQGAKTPESMRGINPAPRQQPFSEKPRDRARAAGKDEV